jgi:RNA polymerase sigma-70 factor (ECF subfamily)
MTDERQLLEAARAGDENAFALLVGPYQAQLHTHCYRMLGSLHDAEDALQETMLRAWSGLARFESRSSLRSWLYRIATNASLRMIEKRPKRVLPIDYGPAADPHVAFGEPLTEPIWLEPYPDAQLGVGAAMLGPDARYEQRESIELAFAAAFQHLPARQRAVLILRDVLGFSARETAETLEMTPVSVDSALQRAHKAIGERVPAQTQQATLRALGDVELRQIVDRFADAWERNDVDAVVAMLADDARMAMPPWPSWYRGRDAIATFLRSWPLSLRKRWQLLHTGANGQPAVAGYLSDEQTIAFRAETIIVLTFQAARIKEITAFRSPELFSRFGLPEQLTNDVGPTTALAPTKASHHASLASPGRSRRTLPDPHIRS